MVSAELLNILQFDAEDITEILAKDNEINQKYR